MTIRFERHLACRLGAIAMLASLCLAQPARSEQISLEPVRDNTLILVFDGSRSNGAGDLFFAGRTMQMSGSLRRGVLAFDVVAAVPAGATIESVSLELSVVMGTNPSDFALHRLLEDWGEGASSSTGAGGADSQPGDATWIHRLYDDSFWTTSGGYFALTPSAVSFVDFFANDRPVWSSAQLAADVQGWLDEPATQYGWILIGDESATGTALGFGSRERAEAADRPLLTIVYTPEPAATSELGAALLVIALWRRSARSS